MAAYNDKAWLNKIYNTENKEEIAKMYEEQIKPELEKLYPHNELPKKKSIYSWSWFLETDDSEFSKWTF